MSRLIDADYLYDLIDGGFDIDFDETPETKRELLRMVKEALTIDAEPVRHGKWIWDEEGYHCSECWYHAQGNTMECIDGTFRFCPVCGVRMDEVNDE